MKCRGCAAATTSRQTAATGSRSGRSSTGNSIWRRRTASWSLRRATGFNSVRVLLEFIVWDEQHDGFLLRFEQFLAVAAKHGISVMVCFANDCTVPKDENYRPQQLGPQPCDWGCHGGRRNSPHSTTDQIGYYPALDEPENAGRFYAMVEEIVTKYAADPRIVIWDLYNEAGAANRGDVSVPHVKRIFDVARSVDPIQPLTSCVWRGLGHFSAAEKPRSSSRTSSPITTTAATPTMSS